MQAKNSSQRSARSGTPCPSSLTGTPGQRQVSAWTRQPLPRQHGPHPLTPRSISTSAPAHAGANSGAAKVQRRRSKLTPAQQQHLADHPPGGERWGRWERAIVDIPHLSRGDASDMLQAHPQLLTLPPQGVAARLAQISQLLTAASIRYDPDAADSKPGPALGDAELAALLRAHPSVLSVSVQQAADVLAWLGSTLDHGMVKLDVSKTVLYAPELLSYSVARLQAQLQGLLGVEGLEQSREELCDRLIHNPRLLTIKTSTLVARLDRLHTEFRCSRKHVLMTASYVLERGPDRLLIRGAFMQGMIGSGAVTLSEVWATSSDARFADFKVRGHLQETSQSLAQFCADVKGLPGMEAALAAAGLPAEVATPAQCLQAFGCLWKSQH
ncbi:MAG: hypothetical protein WDW36_008406 [Sanguina aurantia]